jgi:hypothetical protein
MPRVIGRDLWEGERQLRRGTIIGKGMPRPKEGHALLTHGESSPGRCENYGDGEESSKRAPSFFLYWRADGRANEDMQGRLKR